MIAALSAQAIVFALVAARIAGFVVVSPFPGPHVPTPQKVGLVLVLAWLASSFAAKSDPPEHMDLLLLAGAAGELGCGVVVGITFRLAFVAADTVGAALANATGLSVPSVLDPSIGAQESPVARAATLLATLVALAVGAHRVVLAYLLESFRAIPIGTPLKLSASAPLLVDLMADSMAVGLRLAMPALAMAVLVQIGLAMISRAAPSLQLFNIGLSILLASGFAMAVASANDVGAGLGVHLVAAGARIDAVLSAIAGRR